MYCPPATGISAASSATVSAPVTLINDAAIQTNSSSAGDRTSRAIPAETMKMPEPIVEPATIDNESKSVRRGFRAGGAISTIQQIYSIVLLDYSRIHRVSLVANK